MTVEMTNYQELFGSELPSDQYDLAKRIEKGNGMEKDPRLAALLYMMAADAGNKKAANVFVADTILRYKMKINKERLEVIKAAVEEGYAPAQCSLAARYLIGHGIEKNEILAFELFKNAAEKEYSEAQYYLGMMYLDGIVAEKETDKGLLLIETAANKGSAVAQYTLGLVYAKGKLREKDNQTAFNWMLKSAEQNFMPAQTNIARMYKNGTGTEPSTQEAVKWFEKAGKRGNHSVWFKIGKLYEKGNGDLEQNYEMAVKCYLTAKKHKDAKAIYRLGEMYEKGIYFESNLKKAIQLYNLSEKMGYKKATKKMIKMMNETANISGNELEKKNGDVEKNKNEISHCIMVIDDDFFLKVLNYSPPSEQYEIGRKLETGNNMRKDLNRAALLYIRAAEGGYPEAIKVFEFDFNRKKKMSVTKDRFNVIRYAAEAGYIHAQYSLGGRYRRGIDVPKNYDLAFTWLSKATEQGHADAQFYLGAMYRKGRAVEQDLRKADELTEAAAFRGCAEAQHEMGKKYEQGKGVKKNPETAFKWYLDSANKGYFMSIYRIGEMYRDGIGIEHSSPKAIEWLTKSAEMGYRIAWFTIGQMYEHGYDDLTQNYETAVYYYQEAIKRRYYVASFHIAEMYERGIYFDKDIKKAMNHYKESAKSGYQPAKERLLKLFVENNNSMMYEGGISQLITDISCNVEMPKGTLDDE